MSQVLVVTVHLNQGAIQSIKLKMPKVLQLSDLISQGKEGTMCKLKRMTRRKYIKCS